MKKIKSLMRFILFLTILLISLMVIIVNGIKLCLKKPLIDRREVSTNILLISFIHFPIKVSSINSDSNRKDKDRKSGTNGIISKELNN